MYKDDLIK